MLDDLPKEPSDECSIMEKEDIYLMIWLHYEEARIEINSILCKEILSKSCN